MSGPRTKQASLPACSPQHPLNSERKAEKLWIPYAKQTVEVFLTGINSNLFYCSDSIIELSTAKSTDYVSFYLHRLMLLVGESH